MEDAREPWFVAVGASGAEGLGDLKELLAGAARLVAGRRPGRAPPSLGQDQPAEGLLAQASAMPVVVARDGERFEPGVAYIGEPAEHLTLAARSLGELVRDPGRQHRGRTVDLLFHSVAEHGGPRVIGVVLSGALDDGARGLAAIHHAGGLTMVVTPHSGEPWRGMPENAVAQDGSVSVVGAPREIANAIQAAIRGAPGATGPG